MKLLLIFIGAILILSNNCQKKAFSVEVYPSEVEEDNTIVAGDDLYRGNMRSMWNNVNPYYGYTNNAYMMPPYMPMFGAYNQPVMPPGNFYMNMASQRTNTPDPLNFNYPKLSHAQTSQYKNYPKFKQEKEENFKDSKTQEQENLTKELEKQIKELQKLTKEAKELAKKKVTEDPKKISTTKQMASAPKRLRKSNLDNLTLEATQKTNFDKGIRNIIDKLDNLN